MNDIYYNKRIIVTGHTGFKGSWLSEWLCLLGAKVTGISLDLPSEPNHFQSIKLGKKINDFRFDIRDFEKVNKIILNEKPHFLFHLAAQPIVSKSYEKPIDTWNTNLMGTITILECLRKLKNKCTAVIITSDKCYDNVEWEWGYRENDKLGGPDPYSASKGAAEIAIKSYVKSFFRLNDKIKIASARAGNVIGGGDWATNRIIPDCVNKWSKSEKVELRNPYSTRPWQHVLEPLGGYLKLGAKLNHNDKLHGEAFNFGPIAMQNHSVLDLVQEMSKSWPKVQWATSKSSQKDFHESGLLKLNCDKALHYLNWKALLNFEQTVALTIDWYKSFYDKTNEISKITEKQITEYENKLNSN